MPADCFADPFGLVAFFEQVKQAFGHAVHRPQPSPATAEDPLECTDEDVQCIIQELTEEEAHWTEEDEHAYQQRSSSMIRCGDPFMGANEQ